MNELPSNQALLRAPFCIFLLVAAADGTVDRKEIQRFQDLFTAEEFKPIRDLMGDHELAAESLVQELLNPENDLHEILSQSATTLDEMLEPALAQEMKQRLLRLGEEVAKASGGGLFGLGNKVSQEERTALDAIAQAMGIAA